MPFRKPPQKHMISQLSFVFIVFHIPENQWSNCQQPLDHRKSKRVPGKYLILLYWLCQNYLTVWITINCEKFLKRWGYQTPLSASWEICIQVKKQQLEPDMEQWTGSKLGKEYIKPVHCHPAYLTYIQSTTCEMPGWMNHKLELRLPGEISITLDMQVTTP